MAYICFPNVQKWTQSFCLHLQQKQPPKKANKYINKYCFHRLYQMESDRFSITIVDTSQLINNMQCCSFGLWFWRWSKCFLSGRWCQKAFCPLCCPEAKVKRDTLRTLIWITWEKICKRARKRGTWKRKCVCVSVCLRVCVCVGRVTFSKSPAVSSISALVGQCVGGQCASRQLCCFVFLRHFLALANCVVLQSLHQELLRFLTHSVSGPITAPVPSWISTPLSFHTEWPQKT